jgi:ATP-dependent Clp protease ATP-binding subunit ClpC
VANLVSTLIAALIGVLIGSAAVWLLAVPAHRFGVQLRNRVASAWRGLRLPIEPATPPAAPPATAETAPAPAAGSVVLVGGVSVGADLRRLEAIFAPTANNAAHPRELTEQREFQEAVDLLKHDSVSLQVVLQYALGANSGLACAALAALKQRADGEAAIDEIVAYFDKLQPWPIYFALELLVGAEFRPAVGAPVTGAQYWWGDNMVVPMLFRDYFAQREQLGDTPTFGVAPPAHASEPIKFFLGQVRHPFAGALIAALDTLRRANVDRAFLSSFGRFWEESKGINALVEPDDWTEALAAARTAALAAPARSLLVSGEDRVGKTSFLRLLAARLREEGWSVFEAGGADLMAGQQWFGQLEGRVQRVLDELHVSKKIVWYIPDILQMALSGTHQGQAASLLDQILPAIAAGRLAVWTEASPAGTTRLLRLRPVLRGAVELVRMEPQDLEDTLALARAFVRRLGEATGLAIDARCVETALGSARQYLSASSFPGTVLDLLKLTAARLAKAGNRRMDPHSILETLAQHTGLPASILDSTERVDLESIRDYFSARVMGQREAVDAVVDRIAMLKAGLNDPGKPIGVFLFAGPTGTGKTELAKTAAEFLFGSADRLIRLDMSELQTPESTLKILGGGEIVESDSLIVRVRKQPFSVVLLDEFEKAHTNVWDLFLQVFDDGRLTDSLGNVADFRHCIIILTTNLGATSHRNPGLGFSPAASDFSGDQILQAIGRTFRPEFQNRLDKVIVFHPLTRDLMRDILKKELTRVLERRGLKDREWAVEWEASALEFLLEKGFSPEMGARPLKRAIEQYLIAPLAATIVEKRFPEGDQFVFFRSDGRAIKAEFVDPQLDGALHSARGAIAGTAPGLPAMILAPEGTASEMQVLEAEYSATAQVFLSPEWEERKARLAEEMQAADFWARPGRHETLSRLALMDRVRAAASTAEALRARLARGAERSGKSSRELVGRLALQLHLTKEGIRDVLEAAPIEVGLLVEPALERPGEREATRAWCERLIVMYRAWAGNRHMQLAELSGMAAHDLPLLLISGFGAHRLLEKEAGLHVLEQAGRSRATARVQLAVTPLGDPPPDKLRRALQAALEGAAKPHAVVRRYRSEPSPLVRNMNGAWRTGRLDAVLDGNFDLIAASLGAAE